MGKNAEPGKDGKWPPNVKVEFITPEEREQKLAQAPPGGGASVPTAPGAITTQHFNPNTPDPVEQQAQEATEQVVGRAAINCAKQLGLDFVRSVQSKKKITLESAETICRKNPGLIYFDFDDLEEEVPADVPDEIGNSDLDPQLEYIRDPSSLDLKEDQLAALADELSPEDIAEAEDEEIEYVPPTPRRMTREEQIKKARQIAEQQKDDTFVEGLTAEQRRVPDTSRRAWGGTLSAPGIQVYMHPKGIARVDVEGRVRIQKGQSGNVRTIRIQALEQQKPGGTVRNVTRKTVTGPQAASPNPAAQFRRVAGSIEAPPIAIPEPPSIDTDDDTEY